MKANKNKNQIQKFMSIRKIAERLNPVIVKNILFIHASNGYDTRFQIFNQGKTALMKLIAKGKRKVLEICSAFEKTDASPEETRKAGVKLFATKQGMYYDSFKPLSSQ